MKFNLVIITIFLSIIIYANINHHDGQTGTTLRDGGLGCVCHDITPTDSVHVWIQGPDSVLINSTTEYKLFITGGPGVAGGFDIASYYGALDSVDTLTKVIDGELTHTQPNPSLNDTITWNFIYAAPDSVLTDTLYSVGNSVNGNGNPTFDQWNFGENFVIKVYDNPVIVEDNGLQPIDFALYQNYPNPFNPTTHLQYIIGSEQFVTLKVYDVLGNEVATLVNENKIAGEYQVEFSANGLTSGIYFYKLETENFVASKKMILLK